MMRLLSCTCLLVLFNGCDQGTKPVSGPAPAVPAVPAVPTTPPVGTPPAVPATPSTSSVPTSAAGMTMQAAQENLLRPMGKLNEVLDSIQDDDSARAAAPQIRQLGVEIANGMRQLKTTLAALLTAGQE